MNCTCGMFKRVGVHAYGCPSDPSLNDEDREDQEREEMRLELRDDEEDE